MVKYVPPDRTKNRSDTYQPLFTELAHSHEMMAEFAEEDGLILQHSIEERERLLDLQEELNKETWRLVNTYLTPRQREVIVLWSKGLTQIQIAKRLNVNQSSITKSINGNCDYRNGRKVYGGALRKLRRIAEKDEVIVRILSQIRELIS